MISAERQAYAKEMFAAHPELFPLDHRQEILNGRIVIGMSPFEARLAGGAFAFKLIADAKRWSTTADPYSVMWSQSTEPDESEIWMTFENASQYPGEDRQRIRVYFCAGKARQIDKLPSGPAGTAP